MQRLSNASDTPYDLAACQIGRLPANTMFSRYIAVRNFRLVVGLIGSRANVGTPPSGNFVISIRKNDVQFATVTFASGTTSGVFACPNEVSFVAGDILSMHGPSSADATFANSSYTLAAKI
jgi:hypothetical protein